MTEKFKGRYRVTSSRARWWNYGNNGSYFITICTRNKVHFFGEIEDGKMNRSVSGHIVQTIWDEIPSRFSYTKLGEFVVMPNHVHGIVMIEKSIPDVLEPVDCSYPIATDDMVVPSGHVESKEDVGPKEDVTSKEDVTPIYDVETRLIASLHHKSRSDNEYNNKNHSRVGGITGIHNPMLHQNLSRVMRWFTGRVTYEIHKLDPEFNWQRRFYDHIIKNQNEQERITRYIIRNPLNWKNDRFYDM